MQRSPQEIAGDLEYANRWPRAVSASLPQPDLVPPECTVHLHRLPWPTLVEFCGWYGQIVPEDGPLDWPVGMPPDALVVGTLGHEIPIVVEGSGRVYRIACDGTSLGAWVLVSDTFPEFLALLGID